MKKFIFSLFLILVIFLSKYSPVFASTLYFNNFNSDFSGYTVWYGSCNPGEQGLICETDDFTPNATYQISYNHLSCISGDYVLNNQGLNNIQLSQNNQNLNNVIVLTFTLDQTIKIANSEFGEYLTNKKALKDKHNYKLCQNTQFIKAYLDNNLIAKIDFNHPLYSYFGFQLSQGNSLTNFTATDTLPETTIPLLKQTDPVWGKQTYDGAESWDPQHKTIGDWGCAMTSAAMVLKSHGINKLPDGTELNPGTLNTWLKNQSDGYIDGFTSGYMNPLAITRLAKQAISVNNITSFDALEYQHISGADKTKLTDDLNNDQPDMLEVPGHFIVATSVNENTFDINDPYYDRKNLNEGYNNTFLSLNRYIPSHTDLSYILMTVNPTITVTIKDQNGQTIGDQFIQQPYSDPLNNNHPGGSPLKMIFVQKPAMGNYQITLSGANDQNYQLHTYLYDKNGNANTNIIQGTVGSNNPDSLIINFNNQDSSKSNSNKIATFQSFIDDINENVQLHQINKNIGTALIPLISSAQDNAKKNQKFAARLKLEAIEITVKALRGKGISEIAFPILLDDEQYLKNHL